MTRLQMETTLAVLGDDCRYPAQRMTTLPRRIKATVDAIPSGRTGGWQDEPRLYPPVSAACLNAAEQILGFSLPPILRLVYSEIGNGGASLAGIMGIVVSGHEPSEIPTEDDDAILVYQDFFDNDNPLSWPKGMLPYRDLGCGAWLCVDCQNMSYPVLAHVGDFIGDLDAISTLDFTDLDQPFWVPIAPTLESWWKKWLETPETCWDPRNEKNAG